MRYGFINNFSQMLASDLAAGATTLTLDGGGALLANASPELVYTLTLDDGEGTTEIVHVTGATGNDLTIERGKEGTTDAAWPPGSAVEMRVTAGAIAGMHQTAGEVVLGPGAATSGDDAIVLGPTASGSYRSVSIGSSSNSNEWSVAIGPYAGASDENAVAIGVYAETGLGPGVAIGSGASAASGAVSVGAAASGGGSAAVSIAPSSNAKADAGIAVGLQAVSDTEESIVVGAYSRARRERTVILGANSDIYGNDVLAAGGDNSIGTYSVDVDRVTLLGRLASAESGADESIAIGYGAVAGVQGGVAIQGLPYLPSEAVDPAGVTAENSTRRAAGMVVVATDALDLTGATAAVTLDLPANTRLFIDAIDVIITGSTTPGGTPEIRVGPDDVTPAAYLAATPVTATAVGERESHTPLVADGVTSLRVETVTAGTGTLTAKIVFRGYVMEL